MAVFIRGVFLLALALFFGFSQMKKTQSEVVLKVISPYGGSPIASWLSKEVEDFEKGRSGIRIELRNYLMADYDQILRQNLNNESIDVFFDEARNALKRAGEKNLLLPINEGASLPSFSFFPRIYGALFERDENTYGFPFLVRSSAMFYRRDFFKERKTTTPRTWGQFLSICEDASKEGGFALSASGEAKTFNLLISYFVLREGGVSNYEQLLLGNTSFSNQAIKDAFKTYQSLLKSKCVREDFMNLSKEEAKLNFLLGKSPFFLGSEGDSFEKEASIVKFPFPSIHLIDGGRDVEIGEIEGVYGLKSTKHPKELRLFLKYLATKARTFPSSVNPAKKSVLEPLGAAYPKENLDVYYKVLREIFNAKDIDEKKLPQLDAQNAP